MKKKSEATKNEEIDSNRESASTFRSASDQLMDEPSNCKYVPKEKSKTVMHNSQKDLDV